VPSVKADLRKLARECPHVAEVLVRELVVGVLDPAATLELEGYPGADADFLARVGHDELLHLEFQDYPDTDFVDRLFRQHLSLVLRYPERLVTTVAFWLARPAHPNRVEVIRRGRVMVHVVSVVLPELKASRLLARPETACFAPGADAEGWTDAELCSLVAETLGRARAGTAEWNAALALAATRGRQGALVAAFADLPVDD
jgi:hypothetical protein